MRSVCKMSKVTMPRSQPSLGFPEHQTKVSKFNTDSLHTLGRPILTIVLMKSRHLISPHLLAFAYPRWTHGLMDPWRLTFFRSHTCIMSLEVASRLCWIPCPGLKIQKSTLPYYRHTNQYRSTVKLCSLRVPHSSTSPHHLIVQDALGYRELLD